MKFTLKKQDTLYFHDGRGLRKEDIEAIKQFQRAGNKFGVNTGRSKCMYDYIQDIVNDKIDFDFKIFANGSCILDEDGEVVYERFLPEDFLRYVMENIRAIPLTFHHQSGLYFSEAPAGVVDSPYTVMDYDYSLLPDLKIYELSLDYSLPDAQEVMEKLASYPGVVAAKNSKFCDFNAEGTSKGIGLVKAAELFGFSKEQTAAIGDSYNDIPMIRDAEVGFTFPESDQPVKDAANVLCDGINEAVDYLMNNE